MPDYASRFGLQGKRALVPGASRGIGAEIATVFADAGADVGIVGRDAAGLEVTRQAIVGKVRRCLVIHADLATAEGPRAADRRWLLRGLGVRPTRRASLHYEVRWPSRLTFDWTAARD